MTCRAGASRVHSSGVGGGPWGTSLVGAKRASTASTPRVPEDVVNSDHMPLHASSAGFAANDSSTHDWWQSSSS
ncbi:hypothetical protein OPV22_002102 [Ensete ventricosum]|uniref:Uncharacterized protein n=1 Tax=Ensete ventricosum TaxID=4639 RepID=A0AAV8RWY4_ENSVE|nr:hypothetical protein OPV22_002102 [Ensete ventricosum]